MKIVIALLACLGIVAAVSFHTTNEVKIADKVFLQKQKFLLEIVHRAEDPLMFEEWIKLGEKLIVDKSHYETFDLWMEKFWESWKMGALLPKGEFFGALVKTHHKQAWGLFNFFYFAKDWETFMQNVCWARIHVNEGMFVYALTLAVIHRNDTQGLILPAIHEIFPQHFFNSRFIYEAEKFDFNVWNKLIMYEKELSDVYNKNQGHEQGDYFYIKDWKVWQWYKLMGLDKHWYEVNKLIFRENMNEFHQDPKWLTMMNDVKMFWMPVDYTRDIEIFNEHSKLSYFTEDLGWNTWWYYFNLDHAFFLDGEQFGLKKDRRGEFWIYIVQQALARYYLERLSHGLGDIPEFSYLKTIEEGYDPQLVSYKGVGFSYRQNYYDIKTLGNFEMLHHIKGAFMRIEKVVDTGFFKTHDGKLIDLRKPESIEYIGDMIQNNVDTYDRFFFTYWNLLSHMYFAEVDFNDFEAYPNVMLNFETMMRDPLFYMFYKKIGSVFWRFKYNLRPYNRDELLLPGVEIKDVQVDDLVTYFDLVDHDVTNLLNDKMVFDNGHFVWDKALFARQTRLNHKPFQFDFTVESDKPQKVVIRTFLGPKFDEFGRIISLVENRQNFIEIDEFLFDLTAGENTIKRNSEEFTWTVKDRTTYTELYQYVMMAWDGKYDFPLDISEPHCGFPDRLILPKGWSKGMPMQFFFVVTPHVGEKERFSTYDMTYSCGIGSGVRHIDSLPFGYPLDREIDEFAFLVPNMFFKDVMIYHHDKVRSFLLDNKHKSHFDHNFKKENIEMIFKDVHDHLKHDKFDPRS